MRLHSSPNESGEYGTSFRTRRVWKHPEILLTANAPKRIIRCVYYSFIFLLPFETTEVIAEGYLTLAKLVGYVFVAVALLQPSLCFRRPPKAFWYFAAYLYVFVVLGFTQESEFFKPIFSFLIKLIQMLILFWLSYNIMRDEHVSKATLVTLAASCTLLATLLVMGVGSDADQQGRLSAFGDNPNNTAGVLSLGLLAIVGLAYGPKRTGSKIRLLAWLGLGALSCVLVFTGSRGGIAAVTGGLLAVLLQGRGITPWVKSRISRLRLKAGLIIMVGVSLLIGTSYYYEPAKKRWEMTFTQGSMSGRERIFPVALEMFREKPLLGWGPTYHLHELGARLGRATRDPHNLYLWVLMETGLVGAIPFFMALWHCLRGAWKARGGIHGALPLAMLLAVLILNLSGTWYNTKLFWVVLAYALASGNAIPIPLPKVRKSARSIGRAAA
jgi:hypothetical protein